MVCLGTLLGPEGPGETLLDHSDFPPAPFALRSRWRRCGEEGQILVERPATSPVRDEPGSRSRPYLENCTVDASIKYFVAKLVRAHGGCLGTRSR
jgi:hypothetical protein